MPLDLASELHMRRMARGCKAVFAAAWCMRGRLSAYVLTNPDISQNSYLSKFG
jgi:hypothetical protein